MGIEFNELEEVFSTPNFEVRKGSQVFLSVLLNGDLKDFDKYYCQIKLNEIKIKFVS
jgi:hypothetical protein